MRLCQVYDRNRASAIFQKLEFLHVARYEVCNSDHVDNLIGILDAQKKFVETLEQVASAIRSDINSIVSCRF